MAGSPCRQATVVARNGVVCSAHPLGSLAGVVLVNHLAGGLGLQEAIETPLAYLGYRSHRLVVSNRDGLTHFTEFLGRGKRIGLVPISRERLYVWTTFNSPRASTAWGLESVDAFGALFAEFSDPRVRSVFAQLTSTDAVLCTDIEELHQARWVHERVVLLGDAAHALTPNMGQGAGMAMEDAAVLAEEIAAADRCEGGLVEALGRYVARRVPRVETMARLSRSIGEEGQQTNPIACWLRNRRLRRSGRDTARAATALAELLAGSI